MKKQNIQLSSQSNKIHSSIINEIRNLSTSRQNFISKISRRGDSGGVALQNSNVAIDKTQEKEKILKLMQQPIKCTRNKGYLSLKSLLGKEKEEIVPTTSTRVSKAKKSPSVFSLEEQKQQVQNQKQVQPKVQKKPFVIQLNLEKLVSQEVYYQIKKDQNQANSYLQFQIGIIKQKQGILRIDHSILVQLLYLTQSPEIVTYEEFSISIVKFQLRETKISRMENGSFISITNFYFQKMKQLLKA